MDSDNGNGSTKKVLVVEDEEFLGEVIKDSLTASGYAVLLARDGQEYYKCIKSTVPDIAILDMKLPDVTGVDLIKHLKATYPEVPIIVNSAAVEYIEHPEVKPNIVCFLVKPTKMGELKAKIAETLNLCSK